MEEGFWPRLSALDQVEKAGKPFKCDSWELFKVNGMPAVKAGRTARRVPANFSEFDRANFAYGVGSGPGIHVFPYFIL